MSILSTLSEIKNKPVTKRFEYMEFLIGKQQDIFWGFDRCKNYWLFMGGQHDNSLKMKKSTKYLLFSSKNSSTTSFFKQIRILKNCKSILVYQQSQQRIFEVRLYNHDNEEKSYIFQVIRQYNLQNANTFTTSAKKVLSGQTLITETFTRESSILSPSIFKETSSETTFHAKTQSHLSTACD